MRTSFLTRAVADLVSRQMLGRSRVITHPQQRAARSVWLMLPWFPLLIIVGVIWSFFPSTDRVLVAYVSEGAPTVYYGAWHQIREQYPYAGVFIVVLAFAAVLFVVALSRLAVSFFRSRRHSHVGPRI